MRPASSNRAMTASSRPMKKRDPNDVTDQCMDIERENLALKEKENLLEREITK